MIVLSVMLKQHNATEFLNVEGKTLIHIHEHLYETCLWECSSGCEHCLTFGPSLW